MLGNIDTSFQTLQRDLFESGLVAEMGANSFAIWLAIKNHSDYSTGISYPSIRRLMKLSGLASATVQKAISTLETLHLLRKKRVGRRVFYVARERLDIKVGKLVVCTIVVDYIPNKMREKLAKIKNTEDLSTLDMSEIEILPSEGFVWNGKTLIRQVSGSQLGLPSEQKGMRSIQDMGSRPSALEQSRLQQLENLKALLKQPKKPNLKTTDPKPGDKK